MTTNLESISAIIYPRVLNTENAKYHDEWKKQVSTMSELCDIIKHDFEWCCICDILDVDIIKKYRDDFAANDIFANESVDHGYVLCSECDDIEIRGNAFVVARKNCNILVANFVHVIAYDNSQVQAWNNVTVEANDDTFITAMDEVNVTAYDYSKVDANFFSTITANLRSMVKASGHAVVFASGRAEVKARFEAIVFANEESDVEAFDRVYCCLEKEFDGKINLHDEAVARLCATGKILTANQILK